MNPGSEVRPATRDDGDTVAARTVLRTSYVLLLDDWLTRWRFKEEEDWIRPGGDFFRTTTRNDNLLSRMNPGLRGSPRVTRRSYRCCSHNTSYFVHITMLMLQPITMTTTWRLLPRNNIFYYFVCWMCSKITIAGINNNTVRSRQSPAVKRARTSQYLAPTYSTSNWKVV